MRQVTFGIARCRWLLWGAAVGIAGCGSSAPPSKTAPEQVVRGDGQKSYASEQNFYVVTLTEDAYRRLDIAAGLAKVQQTAAPNHRTLGGEVVVPHGRAIRVTAPLAGVITAPSGGMPRPGKQVAEGEVLVQFTPILAPEAKANLMTAALDAQQQVKSAQIQLRLAQTALDRTLQLQKEGSVSTKVVEEATASRDSAEQTMKAVQARQDLLDQTLAGAADGKATTVALRAPVKGLLQRMSVAPGASVAAGGELFEVVQIDPLWVRVSVYAGATSELDLAANADVKLLGAPPKDKPIAASPVREGPAIADPLAASIDVYYQIANTSGRYRPGQKVEVTLPQQGQAARLVVPWSAVVFDIHGGAWVYEQVAGQQLSFRRRRVEVGYVAGDEALLTAGPTAGTPVVTGGAVELLGAEIGFGAQPK